MPTVIDSLVVLLDLDPKGFDEKKKKALADLQKTEKQAGKSGKKIADSGKEAAKFFNSMKVEAIGLFAAFAGASSIEKFVETVVRASADTGRLAKNLGVTTENLSAWEGAVKQAGGRAGDASGSIQALVSAFEQIQLTGNSAIIPYLQRLGISLKDLENPTEVLLTLADRFHAMKPAEAQALGTGMGLSPSMVNLLEKGRGAVQDYLKTQRDAYVVSEKMAEKSAEAQREVSLLTDRITGLGSELVVEFLPAANKFLDWLVNISEGKGLDPKISKDMSELSQDAKVLSEDFRKLWAALHGNEFLNALAHNLIGALHQGLQSLHHFAQALDAVIHGRFADAGRYALQGIAEGDQASNAALFSGGGAAVSAASASSPAAPAASGGGARRLLDTIAGTESPGYNVMYGGSRFSSYADHPHVYHQITSGPNKGKYTSAAGRYQFLWDTWKLAQKTLGLKDFSPESQDKAALWIAQQEYRRKTGRDLMTDLNDPTRFASIGAALHDQWTSLPGGIEQGQNAARFSNSLASPASLITGAGGGGSSVHIDRIEVHTAATDAHGIARDIRAAVVQHPLVPAANTGLA